MSYLLQLIYCGLPRFSMPGAFETEISDDGFTRFRAFQNAHAITIESEYKI